MKQEFGYKSVIYKNRGTGYMQKKHYINVFFGLIETNYIFISKLHWNGISLYETWIKRKYEFCFSGF